MRPLRARLLSGLLYLLLGAPVALLLHGWLSGPDIQARYMTTSMRIVDPFLTEYRLDMQSATLVDARTGRMLERVVCPAGATFTALEVRFGTRRTRLDPLSTCRVQARLPDGYVFRRDRPLRVTISGNNGCGVMRRSTRTLSATLRRAPVGHPAA